jgi:hypothetical protein
LQQTRVALDDEMPTPRKLNAKKTGMLPITVRALGSAGDFQKNVLR